MDVQARKKRLWFSWIMTSVVWILTGPVPIPWLLELRDRLPWHWLIGSAACLVLIQIVGPGHRLMLALFQNPRRLTQIPKLLSSWAVVFALIASALRVYGHWQDPHPLLPNLHLHSASFLITFYLQLSHLLEAIIRWDRLKALKQLNLTKAMADRLKEAEASTPPFVYRSARKVPLLFTILGVFAILTVPAWALLTKHLDQGFVQAAAVMAICASWIFISGIPATFRSALRTAAYHDILISNATSIEMATRTNAVVFGKRGTLTHGSPHVTDIIPMTHIDEEELLLWAASAEHDSRHPFGQAIVAEAQRQAIPLEPPERFIEMTGRGVQCVIDGEPFRLGKPAFFDKMKIPAYLADRLEILAQEGKTPFICCRGQEFLGIIAVSEEVRPDAAAAIESVRSLGLRTIMLTGDDRMMSEALADSLHIDQVIAEVLAQDKAKEINKLRREGFQVAMVGAYPEDQESFEESELGITLQREHGRTLPPTDVVMVEDKLDTVVTFFEIAQRTVRIARENRLFGYAYHILGASISAGALVPFGFAPLSPVTGSIVSGIALALVILNTRRISSAIV